MKTRSSRMTAVSLGATAALVVTAGGVSAPAHADEPFPVRSAKQAPARSPAPTRPGSPTPTPPAEKAPVQSYERAVSFWAMGWGSRDRDYSAYSQAGLVTLHPAFGLDRQSTVANNRIGGKETSVNTTTTLRDSVLTVRHRNGDRQTRKLSPEELFGLAVQHDPRSVVKTLRSLPGAPRNIEEDGSWLYRVRTSVKTAADLLPADAAPAVRHILNEASTIDVELWATPENWPTRYTISGAVNTGMIQAYGSYHYYRQGETPPK